MQFLLFILLLLVTRVDARRKRRTPHPSSAPQSAPLLLPLPLTILEGEWLNLGAKCAVTVGGGDLLVLADRHVVYTSPGTAGGAASVVFSQNDVVALDATGSVIVVLAESPDTITVTLLASCVLIATVNGQVAWSSENLTRRGHVALGGQWRVQPVLMGETWTADAGANLTRFFNVLNGSDYAAVLNQYVDTPLNISAAPAIFSPTSIAYTPDFTAFVGVVRAAVCKVEAPADFYAIFLDTPRPDNAFFCAFHYYARCGDRIVTFGFHFFAAADSCGGGPTPLAANAAHEFFEAVTDPDGASGWSTRFTGNEIADLCVSISEEVVLGGEAWTLPGMWSNKMGACV